MNGVYMNVGIIVCIVGILLGGIFLVVMSL